MPTAIITGASRGLGRALAEALARQHWTLIIDARGVAELERATLELSELGDVTSFAGDVADPAHRRALVQAAVGEIDLLVNNASVLGPSPQPSLSEYPLETLERVFAVNALAPLALTQAVLGRLAARACIVNVTSDAAVEAYPGWGGYGSAKAALEQLSAVLAAEHPDLRVYAVDPGDMRTRMHQEAFPGDDISDRPLPQEVVPALLRLIAGDLPSGRYRATELLAEVRP